MSYILDALRKSDQLRQRGASPTLLLSQVAAPAPKQPALLYYGLLALVLLAAGIAIGWLRPWAPEPAARTPERVAAKPTEMPAAPAPTPSPTPAPAARIEAQPGAQPETSAQTSAQPPAPIAQAAPVPLPAPAHAKAPPRAKTEKPTPSPKKAAESSKPEPAPERGAGSAPAETAPAPAAAPPASMAMGELPLAIQQELPPMSISVHAYAAKPAERLVGINNRLLHEGAEVAPGLTLEQITRDGMVLNYKGYRFRRGVH